MPEAGCCLMRHAVRAGRTVLCIVHELLHRSLARQSGRRVLGCRCSITQRLRARPT